MAAGVFRGGQRALRELRFDAGESRPYALRRLRARIEANLSGLLGPAMAYDIMDRCVPFQSGHRGETEDLNLMERKLDRARSQFTGAPSLPSPLAGERRA